MGREIYFTLGLELVKVIIEWFRNRESRGAIREAAAKHRCARLRAAGKLPKGVMLGALVGLLAMLGAGCAWLGSIDWGNLPPIPLPDIPPAVTNDVPPVVPPVVVVPGWQTCTKSSNWSGPNAEIRRQNIFSPKCSDQKFRDSVQWAKARGCNTIHVFLANQGDGEMAGYCIYGTSWDWSIDQATVKLFNERAAYILSQGMAYVPWLFSDDSSWNATAAKDFPRYLKDLKACGLFDLASIVVVGLELTEYYETPGLLTVAQTEGLIRRAGKVKDLVAATRAVWPGKIGTHENSGSLKFAGLADNVYYQTSPGKSASWVKAEAARVKKAIGDRWLDYWEIDRHENRELAQAAFDGGADAVGVW